MSATAVVPFGFIGSYVMQAADRHALRAAGEDARERVVAIGVPGGDDDDSARRVLEGLLPRLDAVVLFGGYAFDRMARQQSRRAVLELLEEHRVPVIEVDEESVAQPHGAHWRDVTMSESFGHVADALLARVPAANR